MNRILDADEFTPASRCPVCGTADTWTFARIDSLPTHCNLLCESQEEAIGSERGDIHLSICRNCGHVFNAAFDPTKLAYSQRYEASLDFSPRFARYADETAARLIERHDIRGKDVLEIGCGQGMFLERLCRIGGNRGLGFDPSYRGNGRELNSGQLKIIPDFYSDRHPGHHADLICCRHLLEHIDSPRDFLDIVRRNVGDRADTVLYFEVPNVLFTLRDLGIWDLIYEHCSYYCATSLSKVFQAAGFDVIDVSEAYGGQFLCIEARPAARVPSDEVRATSHMTELASRFAEQYDRKLALWRRQLDLIRASGRHAAVWGGGSKGVTFLNVLSAGHEVSYAIDINPTKRGMFVPGTGHPIVGPEHLRRSPPDIIFIMNPLYEEEISREISSAGISAEVTVV